MKKIATLGVVVCGFFCSAAFGQQFSYGIVGGSALTDDFNQRYVNGFDGYPIPPTLYKPALRGFAMGGAMVEWHFSDSFSVEGDGLFRDMHFSVNGFTQGIGVFEIPVLAKYRWGGWDTGRARVRPFVEGGPSFRMSVGSAGTDPTHFGVSAGGGLEFHVRQWTVAPTLRYTRWRRDDTNFGNLPTRPDQLELLVGFSHTPDRLAWHFGRPERFSVGGLAGLNLLGDYHRVFQGYSGSETAPDGTLYSYQNSSLVQSGPRSFLPGATLEFRIGRGFSAEGDFIFRPVKQNYTASNYYEGTSYSYSYFYSSNFTNDSWQFPLLLKYQLPRALPKSPGWMPFVEAGAVFRTSSDGSPAGFAAGLGVEKRVGLFTFSPQLRYTRWPKQNYYEGLKSDELNLFLGVSFW